LYDRIWVQRKSIYQGKHLNLSKKTAMKKTFEITLNNRYILMDFLKNISLKSLNHIPDGFSNNIIWNIGHVLVVQQMLTYKLSGLQMLISEDLASQFKKGSKPERDLTQEEVLEIQNQLKSTVLQTQRDFEAGIFVHFQEFTSQTGFTMKTLEDALEFNNFHEGLHLGIIMQLKKLVLKPQLQKLF